MRKFFLQEDIILICHNSIRFDIPVVERILNIKVSNTVIIVDTLALAWYLFPQRNKSYGLEAFGMDYGVPKPYIQDWEGLSLEEYIHRCEEDVKINVRLWNDCWSKLIEIYGSNNENKIWEFLKYLQFKMYCAHLAEKNGWKIDIEYTKKALAELEQEREEKISKLAASMPKVPIKAIKTPPAKPYKQNGSLSKRGQEWFDLLTEKKLPWDTQEVEVITGYEEPNPGSTPQVKDWLFSLGWEPQTFKHTKDKDGNPKKIPQINQEHGKGICESIKKLVDREPNLDLLDGLSVLNHRIPILRGLLNTVDADGYVKAQIQGLTNTLRFRHAHPLVNLPLPDRPYGESIRASLICPDGYELCGADMSGLEDRLKQHYIFPLDPEYVRSMQSEDWDPHLDLAFTAGKVTQEQIDKYKSGEDKSIHRLRQTYKSTNYACQYNAYPPRLAITCDVPLEEAQELFDTYWKKNWAIKVVADNQEIKTLADGSMWLKNPVNGFYYSLRKRNDVFSTLIQGTASYVFDLWVGFVLRHTKNLIGQFHDEFILLVKEGFRDKINTVLDLTIKQTNDTLKLNRELGIGVQFGKRYSEIH